MNNDLLTIEKDQLIEEQNIDVDNLNIVYDNATLNNEELPISLRDELIEEIDNDTSKQNNDFNMNSINVSAIAKLFNSGNRKQRRNSAKQFIKSIKSRQKK